MALAHAFRRETRKEKQDKEGKKLFTSKWSTKAAAHSDSTAHCQDVGITVWVLLIQRGEGGGSIDMIENTTQMRKISCNKLVL